MWLMCGVIVAWLSVVWCGCCVVVVWCIKTKITGSKNFKQ